MEAHAAPIGRLKKIKVANMGLVKIGVIAGMAGGMMMAMWQMVVGAIAQSQTADPGIVSSFWTAITSIPSVVFGNSWFHGSFDFWPVALGLGGHMMNSMILGVIGVGLAVTILGPRLNTLTAMAFGMMFGIVLEIVIVNLIINSIQNPNLLYTSTPEWSWWAAHIMFGATVGLVASRLLKRR